MSSIMEVKAQLGDVQHQALVTARDLSSFQAEFDKVAGEVSRLLEGSSEHVDQQMLTALSIAGEELRKSIDTLSSVAARVEQYERQL